MSALAIIGADKSLSSRYRPTGAVLLGALVPCAPGPICEGAEPPADQHCFTRDQIQALATPFGCRNYSDPVPGNPCNYSTVCPDAASQSAYLKVYGGHAALIGPAVAEVPIVASGGGGAVPPQPATVPALQPSPTPRVSTPVAPLALPTAQPRSLVDNIAAWLSSSTALFGYRVPNALLAGVVVLGFAYLSSPSGRRR